MLIGFTGKIGSGKSTAAKYLAEKYGYTRLNFKDALIKEVEERFPELLREMAELYNLGGQRFLTTSQYLKLVPRPLLLRRLLQNYGTDVRRKDDSNYWADKWELLYMEIKNKLVVVDDVRFLNEADKIRGYHGTIIRINGVTQTNNATHSSEDEMSKIQVNGIITNHQSIDDLHFQLDKLCQPNWTNYDG